MVTRLLKWPSLRDNQNPNNPASLHIVAEELEVKHKVCIIYFKKINNNLMKIEKCMSIILFPLHYPNTKSVDTHSCILGILPRKSLLPYWAFLAIVLYIQALPYWGDNPLIVSLTEGQVNSHTAKEKTSKSKNIYGKDFPMSQCSRLYFLQMARILSKRNYILAIHWVQNPICYSKLINNLGKNQLCPSQLLVCCKEKTKRKSVLTKPLGFHLLPFWNNVLSSSYSLIKNLIPRQCPKYKTRHKSLKKNTTLKCFILLSIVMLKGMGFVLMWRPSSPALYRMGT